MHITEPRVAEVSTTTGTGPFATTAALPAHRRFSAVCAAADTFFGDIEAVDGDGLPTGEWVEGLMTYSAADEITVTTVFRSSNANAAVSFAAGTKYIRLIADARQISAIPRGGSANQAPLKVNGTDHNIAWTTIPTGNGTSSGTNTGDQTITLTGNVTGSGTGSFAATIANSAVTLAKQADVATATVFYRKTAGTGAPEVQTLATLKTDLGLTGTNSGDQTAASLQGTGSSASDAGFRGIPQNSNSANYTTVLADSGKHIFHPAADANARTFTIDSNANVAYPVGTAITFVNETSQVVTIAITTDTLTLAGSTTTGSRSLAQNGVATAIKVTSTKWIISGSGLT